MKRRILAALLTVCMLFTMAPTTLGATEGATVSAGDVTVTAGNSVTVTIRADNFENVASLDLFLSYDSSVMSLSSCSGSTLLSGCTYSTNTSTPGEIVLSAISLDGINGSGALLTLRFSVSSTCPAGNYPVTVVVGDAYDTNLQPAPICAVSGKITVNERTVTATTFSTSCSASKSGLYQGDTVTVTVNGSTSRPFVAADFTFDYDPEIFALQSVSLGSNLTKSDAVYSINDALAGQVKISYAAVTSVSSYTLYTVTLKAIADVNGTSKISATASNVYKENLEAYASHTTTRSFTLYKTAQAVDYPDIFLTTQQMTVGQEASSVLKLQAGAGVAAADFVLTYDPAVLRCVSVSVAEQVGQTGGMIVLNDNYYEGAIRFSYINMNGYSGADIELICIVWEPVRSPENHRIVTISGSGVVDANFAAVQLEYLADIGCIYDPIVTPPGCEHDGYTTYYCAGCGDSYVDSYVDALGHIYGDWFVASDATCTEDGTERHDCARCDHYETCVIEATGHNYESVVTAPTCTDQGYTTHTCVNCSDVYVDTYVDALGHSYGEWYTTTEATCTEDGEERHDCANCDHYETAEIEAIGHNYESVVTAPTCTEQGYTTHTCVGCGDSYTETVPATGHNFVDGVCTHCGELEIALGDVNGDGKINTTDAKLVMQYELGMIAGSDLHLSVADVNGDGKINTTDAKLIMQFELGMIDDLGSSTKEIAAGESSAAD